MSDNKKPVMFNLGNAKIENLSITNSGLFGDGSFVIADSPEIGDANLSNNFQITDETVRSLSSDSGDSWDKLLSVLSSTLNHKEAETYINNIKQELSKSDPKPSILKENSESLVKFLNNAGASSLGAFLLQIANSL